jgi:nucleoside-diphosphate-sugar epimerase
MNILVTGANGYLGRALVKRLLANGRLDADTPPFSRLTCVDLDCDPTLQHDKRLRHVTGSIADAAVLDKSLDEPVDLVFHLASLNSRQTETDIDLGRRVNLNATLQLFDGLRQQARGATLVFTSSISVYGAPLPARIDDHTPLLPALSYGAHKQACEILLADYSRRGWINGRTVRLPTIVARPPLANSSALSTFSSDLIRALAAGQPYTCPVTASATMWLMSLSRCIDNLLHAAQVAADGLPAGRALTLPALRTSIGQLIDALGQLRGSSMSGLIDYRPHAALEAQFGRMPPLTTAAADRLGFRHDGSLAQLIDASLATLSL